jgi:hypothetical protein
MRKKIGLTKIRGKESNDLAWVAEAVWMMVMKPAILYAAEVVVYDRQTVQTIEIAQNSIARWITGTSRRASTAGLRAEMGWSTIRGEIAKRKVMFLGKILRMSKNRWPNMILQNIRSEEYESNWFQEVRAAANWLGDTSQWWGVKNWRGKLYEKWRREEYATWEKSIEGKREMKYYTKKVWGKREEFIDGSPESRSMCQIRIGDVGELGQRNQVDQECRCGHKTQDLVKHILIDCPKTEPERNGEISKIVKKGEESGMTKEEIIKEILGDTSKKRVLEIHRIIKEWRKDGES